MDWVLDAACSGIPTDLFFPPPGMSNSAELIILFRICGECPVRDKCLKSALDREGSLVPSMRYGIWGGKTPTQRYHIAKELKLDGYELCPSGLHEMTPENMYVSPSGEDKRCRACRSEIRKRYKLKQRT